jgi:dynein heavy chain 1, cytosolic
MSLNAWLKVCESEMVTTLAVGLEKALKRLSSFMQNYEHKEFPDWIKTVPCQILLLCMQIEWTGLCTAVLRSAEKDSRLTHVLDRCVVLLKILSNRVIYESDKLCRLKLLQLITEVIHQREITTFLLTSDTSKLTDFSWLRCMRFYYNSNTKNISDRVSIEMANASFVYGFEYLGVSEKLVQTPLTDKCFLILTQALHLRLGGNPFGPAGTGKTETVKALGQLFGRFVLVFCCDESFDFQAMGRIFVGLCQVGAWGCFDEFNRLEERILSACSEQILTIQVNDEK